MDQPIFYDDQFILALNRNDLNAAYRILRISYQVIIEEIQTNGPIGRHRPPHTQRPSRSSRKRPTPSRSSSRRCARR